MVRGEYIHATDLDFLEGEPAATGPVALSTRALNSGPNASCA